MLTVLIDSWEYSLSNCYQHQLIRTLLTSIDDVKILELSELEPDIDGPVLSCLKLRTLDRGLGYVSSYLRNNPVMVYDQDPWENFIVGSPYFGSYGRIASQLNVTTFFNTSKWWSDRVKDSGLPSQFVNLWMRPEYCVTPVPWERRKNSVVFCGTLYPRRQKFFDELKQLGLDVHVTRSSMGYSNYLDFVSSCKVMIRSEKIDWRVSFGGQEQQLELPNALWIRDVECAARACFSLRESDPEKLEWGLDTVSSIISFSDAREAVEQVQAIMKLSPEEAEARLTQGSARIKEMDKWQTIVQAIKEHV